MTLLISLDAASFAARVRVSLESAIRLDRRCGGGPAVRSSCPSRPRGRAHAQRALPAACVRPERPSCSARWRTWVSASRSITTSGFAAQPRAVRVTSSASGPERAARACRAGARWTASDSTTTASARSRVPAAVRIATSRATARPREAGAGARRPDARGPDRPRRPLPHHRPVRVRGPAHRPRRALKSGKVIRNVATPVDPPPRRGSSSSRSARMRSRSCSPRSRSTAWRRSTSLGSRR